MVVVREIWVLVVVGRDVPPDGTSCDKVRGVEVDFKEVE